MTGSTITYLADYQKRHMKFSDRGFALFSECQRYRYFLHRTLAEETLKGAVTFCMLNPSTADERIDDPTVRRCLGFAKVWGYSTVQVVNIFALRSTDPRALRRELDPIGPDNDEIIRLGVAGAERVVCAWGVHGKLRDRGRAVLKGLLASDAKEVVALRLTHDGIPQHPLYLPYGSELIDMRELRGRPQS